MLVKYGQRGSRKCNLWRRQSQPSGYFQKGLVDGGLQGEQGNKFIFRLKGGALLFRVFGPLLLNHG